MKILRIFRSLRLTTVRKLPASPCAESQAANPQPPLKAAPGRPARASSLGGNVPALLQLFVRKSRAQAEFQWAKQLHTPAGRSLSPPWKRDMQGMDGASGTPASQGAEGFCILRPSLIILLPQFIQAHVFNPWTSGLGVRVGVGFLWSHAQTPGCLYRLQTQ